MQIAQAKSNLYQEGFFCTNWQAYTATTQAIEAPEGLCKRPYITTTMKFQLNEYQLLKLNQPPTSDLETAMRKS